MTDTVARTMTPEELRRGWIGDACSCVPSHAWVFKASVLRRLAGGRVRWRRTRTTMCTDLQGQAFLTSDLVRLQEEDTRREERIAALKATPAGSGGDR